MVITDLITSQYVQRLEQSRNAQNLGHVSSMSASPRDTYADASADSAGGSSLEKSRTISHTERQMLLKGCHASLAVISTLGEGTKYNIKFLQSSAWLN